MSQPAPAANGAPPPSSAQPNGTAAAAPPASASSSMVQPNGTATHTPNGPLGGTDGASGSGQTAEQDHLAQLYAQRREEEAARRDRSLAEFLTMLDGYKPLIPEEVTEYYLQRSGFECSDPRLKRLLSLSAQKFISDLSKDAYHYAKLRVNGTAVGRGRPAAGVDRNRVVLTMDDLSQALGDHGVNVKKPDYYL